MSSNFMHFLLGPISFVLDPAVFEIRKKIDRFVLNKGYYQVKDIKELIKTGNFVCANAYTNSKQILFFCQYIRGFTDSFIETFMHLGESYTFT
jgi:hypothetical protein